MRPLLHIVLGQLMMVAHLAFADSGFAPGFPSARDCVSLLEQTSLTDDQAIELLSALPYLREARVRILTADLDVRRTVVLIGENHHAYVSDIRGLKSVIDEFETIATENGITNDETSWTYPSIGVARVLTLPHRAFERMFTERRQVSAMHYARHGRKLVGKVRNIERSHAPHWSEDAHLLTLAGVSALRSVVAASAKAVGETGDLRLARASLEFANYILERFDRDLPLTLNRDRTIAREIRTLTFEKKSGPSSLVIVGLVHLANTVEELVTRHGFTEIIVPSNRVSQSDTGVSEL